MEMIDIHHSSICYEGCPTFTLKVVGTPPSCPGSLSGIYVKFVVIQNYFWIFGARSNVYISYKDILITRSKHWFTYLFKVFKKCYKNFTVYMPSSIFYKTVLEET